MALYLLTVLGTSNTIEILLQAKSYEIHSAENVTRQEHNINKAIELAGKVETSAALRYYKGNKHSVTVNHQKMDQLYHRMGTSMTSQATNLKIEFLRLVNDRRETRAPLDFLGDIISDVTGIPSASQARRYEEAMKIAAVNRDKQRTFNKKLIEDLKIIHKVEEKDHKAMLTLANETNAAFKLAEQAESHALGEMRLISFQTTFYAWCAILQKCNTRIQNTVIQGLQGLLSPFAISKEHMKEAIDIIEKKEDVYRPIFGSHEVHQYYKLPLAKIHQKDEYLYVTYQVPLVEKSRVMDVRLITEMEKIEAKVSLYSLDLVAESMTGRYHMYLTEVEYENCIQVPGSTRRICRERKPRIYGKMGDLVIHQLSHTAFAVKMQNDIKAQLDCKDHREQVIINSTCIIELPFGCAIKSETFEIPTTELQNIDIPDVEQFKIKFDNPILKFLEKPITDTDQKDFKKEMETSEELLSEADTKEAEMEEENDSFWGNIHWPSVAPHIGWGVIIMIIVGIGICCWCQNKNTFRSPFGGH